MNCNIKNRERVRRAAEAIRGCAPAISVDILSPTESQYDQWTIDAVLEGRRGVPPAVLRELALEGLTLQPTPSQSGVEHVAATV